MHLNEIESQYLVGGTHVEGAGTITGVGIDWSPYFEPQARMSANIGVSTGGSLIFSLQQSNTLGSGYTTVGTVTANGAGAGTTVAEYLGGAITARYVRAIVTNTAGTADFSVTAIGKRRTITA